MILIINADDLGQTIEQNIAIEKAFDEGVISSSTIQNFTGSNFLHLQLIQPWLSARVGQVRILQ